MESRSLEAVTAASVEQVKSWDVSKKVKPLDEQFLFRQFQPEGVNCMLVNTQRVRVYADFRHLLFLGKSVRDLIEVIIVLLRCRYGMKR